MISLILGSIPIIYPIAAILAIVGIVLLILGREVFEPPHSSYVVFAVIIWLIALPITFIGGLLAAGDIAKSPILAVSDLLLTGFLDTLIVGIAYILLTYALQKRTGRMLLYVAYASSVALSILVLLFIGGRTFNTFSLGALQTELQQLQLLALIPDGIFVVAYYIAYRRIDNGEIPPSQTDKVKSGFPSKRVAPQGYAGD